VTQRKSTAAGRISADVMEMVVRYSRRFTLGAWNDMARRIQNHDSLALREDHGDVIAY